MALLPFAVPPALRQQEALGPGWSAWLAALPRRAAELAEEWGLEWDLVPEDAGTAPGPWCGHGSLVVPVRAPDGEAAALKVAFDGDDEGLHEALALQHWAGDGAVRLLRADPRRRALLLERLTTTDLADTWDVEACETVATLVRRRGRPAPPQLLPVTDFVGRWAEGLGALPRDAPVPHRMVEQWASALRELRAAEDRGAHRIVHGDLHYANVLADTDGAWRVIDPKPMAGDAHYEPAPMLWNRWNELEDAAGGVRGGLRRRFHALVDDGGLDEERARAWVLVRMVLNAYWTVDDARTGGRRLSAGDRAWITRCVTIVKAVQD